MKIWLSVSLPLLVAVSAMSPPAQAHHSAAASYLVHQRVEIEGTVVQFFFGNPHSFVHVMAPDKDGVMQQWDVEWGAGGNLAGDDISRDTLKPGDKVKISGSPARNSEDHRLRLATIERTTDHWRWGGSLS